MRAFGLWFALLCSLSLPLRGQDLDTSDVRVPLDSALRLAKNAAGKVFPDLRDYLLYSIKPRVLKADPSGLHWEVDWQHRAFPHRRWLVVRVYMKDGHTTTERLDQSPQGSSDTAAAPR